MKETAQQRRERERRQKLNTRHAAHLRKRLGISAGIETMPASARQHKSLPGQQPLFD